MNDERFKKNSGIRYPLELKKKTLMELAEIGRDSEQHNQRYKDRAGIYFAFKSNSNTESHLRCV